MRAACRKAVIILDGAPVCMEAGWRRCESLTKRAVQKCVARYFKGLAAPLCANTRLPGLHAVTMARSICLPVIAGVIVSVGACSRSSGPPKKVCYPVKGELLVKDKPAEVAMVILRPQQ